MDMGEFIHELWEKPWDPNGKKLCILSPRGYWNLWQRYPEDRRNLVPTRTRRPCRLSVRRIRLGSVIG